LLRVPASATVAAQRLDLSPPGEVSESLRFVVYLHQPPTVVDGHSWRQTNMNASLIVDRTGRIEHTLADWSHHGRHDGRRVEAFSVKPVGDLPSFPLSISQIGVIEPIPVALTSGAGESPTSGTERFNAYPLLTYNLPAPSTVTEAAGGYRVDLPDEFWQQVSDAEVRARLKAPPPGWKIVDVPLGEEPAADAIYAERRIDLMLSYFARRNTMPIPQAVKLTQGSEIIAVHDGPSEDPLQLPIQRWFCSLLVTDHQAELIAVAQKLEGADFQLRLVRGDPAPVHPEAVDTALLEMLKIDGPSAPAPAVNDGAAPADG
jgi:hypothetical protein